MEESEILTGEQEEEVVTPQEGDAAEQSSGGAESPESAERDRQSREDNRRYQAARQAGERSGYDRAIREMNERISRAGMRASDGSIIEDIDGLESFGKRYREENIRARAQREGRSVEAITEEEDNREYVRRAKAREKAEAAERRAREEQERFVQEDLRSFAERFPGEDAGKLMKNPTFLRFAGSRLGRESLGDLFDDYQALRVSARETRTEARSEDKAERATGSGGGSAGEIKLTARQQRELEEWNRQYPDKKMTAKEFADYE